MDGSFALRIGLAALVAAALAGCARNTELKHATLAPSSTHVSPPPVAVPRLPPGTFDQGKERADLAAAERARSAGNASAARRADEAAVADWPGDAAAWKALAADCRNAGDESCARYADFFAAKIDFVATLPPRAAVLGFATLATAGEGARSGDYIYDRRTLDTALRLASFYDEQDRMREVRAPTRPKLKPNP